jgi:anthranilate synthase component 2
MKVLLIDNYDSFTWNLHHLLIEAGLENVQVATNDRIDDLMITTADALVFSPGPGLPDEAGQMKCIVRKYSGIKKMLGVCLGHQAIAEVFGASLIHADEIFHGTATRIEILEHDYLFRNLPEDVSVGRYHSWVVNPEQFPERLKITAIDSVGNIMAIRHRTLDITGVQFHPESIMTPLGVQMIRNWMHY